jgi:hypothetical protein
MVPLHSYSYNDGRAGVASRGDNALQHKILHSLQALGRDQHFQLSHFFAPAALRQYGQFQLIAGHDLGMDHRRRVVARIFSVEYGIAAD